MIWCSCATCVTSLASSLLDIRFYERRRRMRSELNVAKKRAIRDGEADTISLQLLRRTSGGCDLPRSLSDY